MSEFDVDVAAERIIKDDGMTALEGPLTMLGGVALIIWARSKL